MIPLTQLQIGCEAQVSAITSVAESRLCALSMFGIVPGSRLTLRQRQSAYIVSVGETDIALDIEIAREIMVHLAPK